MLELLRIHDLALIEDIEMEFVPGMNVLTGETGAGKSFIIKALNFLTGEKLSSDLVRPGKEKAQVEALFIIDGEQSILRRELMAETGRSRFYLNDRLCSQETIREMRSSLLLHTSQHGQQKLLQPSFQAHILDTFMQRPDLIEKKDALLAKVQACQEKRLQLEEKVRSLEEKRDVLEFQQHEIDKVKPKPGEEEELEAIRMRVRNHADITASASNALQALLGDGDGVGVLTGLNSFERAIHQLSKVHADFQDIPSVITDVRSAMHDVEQRLRKAVRARSDEEDIEAIEERLYALAQLKRKLKRPLEAIIALHEEIAQNLDFLDSCQLERKLLHDEESQLCDSLALVVAELNAERQRTAGMLGTALEDELKKLGFSEHVHVVFEFSPHKLYPDRDDCTELRARLLWQPNPGQAAQPLDKIASGGELSRFLLAVVSLMTKSADVAPTLIFDEVDAGVGGLTLNKVAESLERLAEHRQMLLITHWPQLAKRAKRHFYIQKHIVDGQTFTQCTRLQADQVTEELSRMAGESAH